MQIELQLNYHAYSREQHKDILSPSGVLELRVEKKPVAMEMGYKYMNPRKGFFLNSHSVCTRMHVHTNTTTQASVDH